MTTHTHTHTHTQKFGRGKGKSIIGRIEQIKAGKLVKRDAKTDAVKKEIREVCSIISFLPLPTIYFGNLSGRA